jgi:molybdate transport system substrate-binding protein
MMTMTSLRRAGLMGLAWICGWLAVPARADEVRVAVAANFSAPLQAIARAFAARTGQRVEMIPGSTGQLAAQIRNGAPFDVLLSADTRTPQDLEAQGLGMKGWRFTYAIGQLVLYSAEPGKVDADGQVLKDGRFRRLAVADPRLAPYGAAAMEVLQSLGLRQIVAQRIVTGENITQTYQFVRSGNADLGFVALSQVVALPPSDGSYWRVPASLYTPLRQDAMLLVHGQDKPAARAFLDFVRQDEARALIRRFGYDLP